MFRSPFWQNKNQLSRLHSHTQRDKIPTTNYRGYTNDSLTKMVKEVRRFLGVVQFYRVIWQTCGHILTPMVELTGGKKLKNSNKMSLAKKLLKIKNTIGERCDAILPNYLKKSFYIRMQATYN